LHGVKHLIKGDASMRKSGGYPSRLKNGTSPESRIQPAGEMKKNAIRETIFILFAIVALILGIVNTCSYVHLRNKLQKGFIRIESPQVKKSPPPKQTKKRPIAPETSSTSIPLEAVPVVEGPPELGTSLETIPPAKKR
jgi:hypothetical protein